MAPHAYLTAKKYFKQHAAPRQFVSVTKQCSTMQNSVSRCDAREYQRVSVGGGKNLGETRSETRSQPPSARALADGRGRGVFGVRLRGGSLGEN